MIQSLADLRAAINSQIRVIPNNETTKTQAADVKQLLTNIIDTTEDLVNQLGLLLNQNISNTKTDILQNVVLNTIITQYAKLTDIPDTSIYQTIANAFTGDYTKLSNKPDLTVYRLNSSPISYTTLTNLPTLFDGTWTSLASKPTLVTAYSQLSGLPVLFNGDYNTLVNKPTIPTYDLSIYQKTSDNIAYSRLTGAPTIPIYDLSLYRKTADTIDYTTLTNKPTLVTNYSQLAGLPTLVTDYSQLTNKPTIPIVNYPVTSVNTRTGDIVVSKSDVGLGNVNNTADTDKPVSTATQTALALKANSSSLAPVALTGNFADLTTKPKLSMLLWNQTTPFNYINSVAETNVLIAGNGNGTLSIDANPLIGTSFRFTGRGLFNTQSVTSPTLTIKLYLGNTVIATGSVSSLLIAATNRPLSFYVDILIAGTNSVYTQGSMTYFGAATDILSAAPITNNGINATVDLTTSNQLKMTLTWSVASASNVILMKIINLEKLNN